ncbi:phosphatase PAP2 family protein [Calidifontibacter sp. DB0510]|uniref:Phosphatase PAP2 family protein n=1 Tax=Metallococcus carri TaxID=1656884 RepID=A0A967B3E1_9MICO|nr:phosphatase PAP2 family protein [Metallococcus carri]NHN56630.1 phosphatase PAP2 family protein [Metallococcus carri]NOP38929.1 phosphatase PAP2 family protein [Calidifontibacter sp. DB2511S]
MPTAPPDRSVLRPALHLLGIALLSLAGMWVLMRFALHSYTGRQWDTLGMYSVGGTIARYDRMVLFLSIVTVPHLIQATLVCTVLAAIQRRWAVAAAIPVMIAGASVTTQVLKNYVFHAVTGPNTLPSGHSTTGVILAVASVWAVPRIARPYAVAAAGFVAVSIGMGTVAAYWHRPSDVYAAALVCLAWLGLGAAGVLALRARSTTRLSSGRPWPLLAASILAMVGAWLFIFGLIGYRFNGASAAMYLFDAFVTVTVTGGCALVVWWAALWADRFDPRPEPAPRQGSLGSTFGDSHQASHPSAPIGTSSR